jgi:site-specific recombinase
MKWARLKARFSWPLRLLGIRKDLDYLLAQADPKLPLTEQVLWLADLLIWIRTPTKLPSNFGSLKGQLQDARIRFLFHLLEKNPQWKKNTGQSIVSILSQVSSLQLFSQTGLSRETGLVSEIYERLLSAFLPSSNYPTDLAHLFSHIFTKQSDAEWIRGLTPQTISQIEKLLIDYAEPTELWKSTREDISESLLLLSAEISALGLRSEIRERSPKVSVRESPFFELNQEISTLTANRRTCERDSLKDAIRRCRNAVSHVVNHLESSGVSIDLVFQLERITEGLKRIEILVQILSGQAGSKTIAQLISDLIEDQNQRKSISELLTSAFRQLSRKIVERAGETGEHYITRNRKEYFEMLKSGMGGGAITAITTFAKYGISSHHLPLFIEGVVTSLNYAISFVVIYWCGFTLATKQPSSTAPALAGKLSNISNPEALDDFVKEVAHINRSQFAAVVGNVSFVILCTAIVDWGSYLLTGSHFFSDKTAEYVFDSLNPLKSMSIIYALFTGILLWLSSIFAGAIENWVVFRRLPEAIAHNHRFHLLFGKKYSEKLSLLLMKHTSAISGNIVLGFLLGMTHVMGTFFGLPIDVRHVTLSSGAFSLAVCSAGPSLSWNFILPCLGIILIGFCNFAMSFALALAVAIRARNIQGPGRQRIRIALLKYFRDRTRQFFFP